MGLRRGCVGDGSRSGIGFGWWAIRGEEDSYRVHPFPEKGMLRRGFLLG
jgi:hypothetical protein